MMTTVLRILRHTDLVQQQPLLAAFCSRCEARPAFRKALADQMAKVTGGTFETTIVKQVRIDIDGSGPIPTREVTLDRLGRKLLDGRALSGGNLLHALVNGVRNRDALGGHDQPRSSIRSSCQSAVPSDQDGEGGA